MSSRKIFISADFSNATRIHSQGCKRVLSRSSNIRERSSQLGNFLATIDIISKLPANVEAERSILGAILLDNMAYNEAAENLRVDDFSLDSHRRIYARMMDLMES